MLLTLGLGSKQERKGYDLKWYGCVTVAVLKTCTDSRQRGSSTEMGLWMLVPTSNQESIYNAGIGKNIFLA